MMESFGGMAFRPQRWVAGYPNYEHNPDLDASVYENEEQIRPQVMAGHAWGAQKQGWWDYLEKPLESRARGGRARGGFLLCPPEYEMEDYFGINSTQSVYPDQPASYFTAAPGVSFALGTPTLSGGLNNKSVVITQDLGSSNDAFGIYQVDGVGTGLALLYGEVDQSSSEVVVEIGTGGRHAIRIPRGTTAQRPSALAPVGGELRVNTDLIPNKDVLEYYDQQTSSWRQIESTGTDVSITFSATSAYPYYHGWGLAPAVQVLDSTGHQVEVDVVHTHSQNMVVLHFPGITLTDATLILS